ncbi:MAG: BamA/TamA family outer membrane protein [Candidatus Fermentibacteria bacterium]
MIYRTKTIVIMSALLCALPLHAWRVFPLISYSSTSGVLFGGIVSNNMIPPFKPFGFSAMAYMYTDGSIFAEPTVLFPAGNGLVTLSASYKVRKEVKFFGWGNGGDNDLYANYNAEMQDISASYNFSPLSGLTLTGGLLCRHSTVYDRSDSELWSDSPTEEYGSRWTGGPFVESTWIIPAGISGYVSAGGDLQLGDDDPYYSAECALAVFAPIGSSTTPAFRMKIERHIGAASTPFSYLPSLGGSSGLRGYSDARFGGNWVLLSNLELRQRILSFSIDENNTMDVSLVLFGDAGQVADHLDECHLNRFHLDGGAGLRLSMPGGASLRVDFAKSPEGLGIQMGLGELF